MIEVYPVVACATRVAPFDECAIPCEPGSRALPRSRYHRSMACIQIIDVPPGPAPEWVRREWVGLVLSLPEGPIGRRRVWSGLFLLQPRTGCLSNPVAMYLYAWMTGNIRKVDGYAVEARRAVDVLAMDSPEAADWWRQNAPELLRPGRMFVFHAEVCEQEP
jgi:hypothetical protein